MQRGRVDDEHAKTCACEDPRKVVVVPDNGLAEREAELGLDSENLTACLSDVQSELSTKESLTLKHWTMKIERYTASAPGSVRASREDAKRLTY